MKTLISHFSYFRHIRHFIYFSISLVLLSLAACDDSQNGDAPGEFIITGLTMDNYPKVDGSTSTEPLQLLIACKLLGVDYSWVYMSFMFNYPYHLMPACDVKPEICRYITERIHHNGTHGSFVNLITGRDDLILTARSASDDEYDLADSLGVTLTQTPVALDAFIFLVNNHNSVTSLSTKEIQDIYTGSITH